MTDEIMLTPLAAGIGKLMSYCMLLNNALLGYMKKSGEDDGVVLAANDEMVEALGEVLGEIADTMENRAEFLGQVKAVMVETAKIMEVNKNNAE